MKKKLLWIVSILLVLVAVVFLLKYDLKQKRTTDGIDISHHNVVRDWDKVNIGFIYAKATEGRSHRDTKFVRFIHATGTGEWHLLPSCVKVSSR